MEGSLSKWTNIVNGWQFRYFVLNDDLLLYYTSKEKKLRGVQRGYIRLCGAAIGIDGENNCLFTITVDGKTFHLQGRDQAERDAWVRVLERVIHENSGYYKCSKDEPIIDLEKKVALAEQQSHMLLEQVRKLEQLEPDGEKANAKKRKTIHQLTDITKRLQNTIDLSVIVLQQVMRDLTVNGENVEFEGGEKKFQIDAPETNDVEDLESMDAPGSYSSSEDEFFDADSTNATLRDEKGILKDELKHASVSKIPLLDGDGEPDWGDANENFDQIYENSEENELGNVQQQHGSVLMHLLSQVSVGMDLTKVTLPTFILERRSLLEMYADFFAHPDDFIGAVDLSTPEERFISVIKYYLNSIYPARKSGVAKKPYNPILGETFRCRWTLPNSAPANKSTEDGPFPGSDYNQVTFIAEQVSHHPPISAFYAEHPAKRISFNAHIWTKSSFLGLSIGVTNVGFGVVKLHDYNESYVVTFPNGYGRSIMSTPWVELGGKVEVKCEATGYSAEIDFLSKPFFGGKPHKISGSLYKAGSKKAFMTLRGDWNGHIYAKRSHEEEFHFSDVRAKPDQKKECVPVAEQAERESRRLWRHVTAALYHDKINIASSAKRHIEQRQRDEAKKRQEAGSDASTTLWTPQYFEKTDNDSWVYKNPLDKRLETL